MSVPGIAPKSVSNSEVRLKLLGHLSKGAMTPTELASLENKHVSHVSRALAELRADGLVVPLATESRSKYYQATEYGIRLYAMMRSSAK